MEKTTRKLGKLAPYCYILPITAILVLFVITSVIISLTLGFSRYNIMTPAGVSGIGELSPAAPRHPLRQGAEEHGEADASGGADSDDSGGLQSPCFWWPTGTGCWESWPAA
jgi:ABC-type sugar transport system permease subunit